jgi:hypothetical protein
MVHSAKFFYVDDEVTPKRWIKQVLDAVENGKVSNAIMLVEEKRVGGIPGGIVNLCTYINNNKNRIDYKAYKDKGYFIGSGAIESAVKNVIQQRMKQSGIRWGINGRQYIALLRAKHENNLWCNAAEAIGV